MADIINSKKIAKNTFLLYFRMILYTLVSLYTSRIILQVMGVEDFGIYNIVAGVVIMFSFINTFLTNACQRFLSVAIAEGDENDIRSVFSTSIFVHCLIVLLFVLAAETIGLWFVCNKLVIPEPRMTAALWAYQIMVFETVVSIIKIPYNAVVVSEERMSFFAYVSIAESVIRLISVFVLLVISYDKLITYSVFHCLIGVISFICYVCYCRRIVNYSRFSIKYDKTKVKEMTSFSVWNVFGSVAEMGYNHGTNIVLNLFHGVALNAALGIAASVRSAVYSFIVNIQMASNPQIIKSYAIEEFDYYRKLVNRISKYSYYMMLFLSIPIALNIEYILKLWLGEPPAYADKFLMLGLMFCLTDALHGPLWVSMQATGKIMTYQLCVSFLLLLNLPFSYIVLDMGYPPESIMVVQIILSIIVLMVRLVFSKVCARLEISKYIMQVFVPIVIVTVISVPLPVYISTLFADGFLKLMSTGAVSVVCVCAAVYFVGMDSEERKICVNFINSKLLRFVKHNANTQD